MTLLRNGHLTIGNPELDTDIRDLTVVSMDAGTFIYAANGRNGGVLTVQLDPNGGLAEIVDGNVHKDAHKDAAGAFTEVVEVNGKARAIFGGTDETDLLGYTINADGTLGSSYPNLTLSEGTDRISSVLGAQVGDEQIIIIADEGTGTLSSYATQQTNAYVYRGAQADVSGPVDLALAQVGGAHFVLATDTVQQQIVSYAVDSTGTLTQTDIVGAADGLGLSVPTAVEVVQAHGATWVVLGSAGSASISVMQLDAFGDLTPTDHLIDTRNTRFDALQDMAVVAIDGWAFAVAGGGDDGLSLFTLLPNGRMLHLETIIHDVGSGLQNINAIEAVVLGDEVQVFVTSGTAGGITQFSMSLADLGQVISADPHTAAQTLTGGTADDLISASAQGHDTLYGGAGDDILMTGSGDAQLWGGAGADTFVFGYRDQTISIMDFTVGVDQLDLSAFPMLYDASRLGFEATQTGTQITFGTSTIIVHESTSQPLTAVDLFGAEFSWANHVLYTPEIVETDTGNDGGDGTGDATEGGAQQDQDTSGDDQLVGTNASDTLFGGLGADNLAGGDGDDTLDGGDGDDVISGMDGDDVLTGGAGGDRIWGGEGHDIIRGGSGVDVLVGSNGNDSLYGEGWRDSLMGKDGDDSLFGGQGADNLSGGYGNDTLTGGDGNDQLAGDHGDDFLFGGLGNDKLGGFVGNDWFYGGDGDDVIWGDEGADRGWGGAGDDRLGGGRGNDTLYGEDGADLVWGGHHDDWQYGGEGDDTVGGFSGHDILFGGNGNDHIWGNVGNDIGYGGDGNDIFGGFNGNDTFYGGNGDDTISGGRGDDALHGGAGADTFRFLGTFDHDTVHDFNADLDVLNFGDESLTFDALDVQQLGSDTLITVRKGSVTLQDFQASDLDDGDFLFG